MNENLIFVSLRMHLILTSLNYFKLNDNIYLDMLILTLQSSFVDIFKQHLLTYQHIQGSLNKFPDFFRMGTFIDSTHMKL